MDKNQIQNFIFVTLGISLLVGAGIQFIKNRNNFQIKLNLSESKETTNQKPKINNPKNIEGSNNEGSISENELSLNDLDKKKREKIDHSDPKNQHRMGIFHYNEGNKFLAFKEWTKAIKNYQMSLKHDKNLFEVYINLSVAQLRIKKFDHAYRTLLKLKSFQPQNPSLFYNLACYYSLTKQLELGRDAIQKSIQLGFKDFQLLKEDPDLENLKNDLKYNKWLKSL